MDISGFIGGLSGLAAAATLAYTALKGLPEYRRQGRLQRANRFVEIRHGIEDVELFRNIWNLIDEMYRCRKLGDEEGEGEAASALREIPWSDRSDLLGRYEEVGLLVESKLLNEEIAQYMFGWRLMRLWECEPFWHNLEANREENPYLVVLRRMYQRTVELDRQWRTNSPRRVTF